MPLTDLEIKALRPDAKTRRYAGQGGLNLEVTPAGGRYWRYKYRIAGRENRLALGVYRDVPLGKAREHHANARKLAATGIDPSAEKQSLAAAKRELAVHSFEAVAREYVEAQSAGWAPGHARTVTQRLANNVYPWLGRRPIAELTAADVLAVLRRIEQRGAQETAHRVRVVRGQVLAIETHPVCLPAAPVQIASTWPGSSAEIKESIPEREAAAAARARTMVAGDLIAGEDLVGGTHCKSI